MAQWQRVLDLSDVWDIEEAQITHHQLADIVADRLAALPVFEISEIDQEKEEIIDDFRDIASDKSLTVDHFDGVMERLYDWGDICLNPDDHFFRHQKLCWIKR